MSTANAAENHRGNAAELLARPGVEVWECYSVSDPGGDLFYNKEPYVVLVIGDVGHYPFGGELEDEEERCTVGDLRRLDLLDMLDQRYKWQDGDEVERDHFRKDILDIMWDRLEELEVKARSKPRI